MPNYIVSILRKSIGFNNVQIDAPDKKTAKKKALDEAGHHAYAEHSSEYEVIEIGEEDE